MLAHIFPCEQVAEFRPVDGFPGYEVSSDGRVMRPETVDSQGRRAYGKELRQETNREGYKRVLLMPGRKHKTVHRLVMEAFVGPSDLVINHINSDPGDNRLENLEYCTQKYNVHHAQMFGKRPQVLTPLERDEIKRGSLSAKEVAKKYDVSYKYAWSVLNSI